MGLGIFRYAASLPAQTAERMSRRLARTSASKGRRAWLRSLLAAAVAVVFASTAVAEKRVALIVANGAYKGAPLENPTVDADRVAASLTNIGFVVKVMKNVDLDEFDRGVTTHAASRLPPPESAGSSSRLAKRAVCCKVSSSRSRSMIT